MVQQGSPSGPAKKATLSSQGYVQDGQVAGLMLQKGLYDPSEKGDLS